MNAEAGIKRKRNIAEPANTNNNNSLEENVAEVNVLALIEQFKKLGRGNQSSPGFRLTESLENLPVRALNSPPDSPSIPYRNLFPKPLRRFGSLPLAAMGASPPSEKKYKASVSEGNIKSRRSRRSRRGGRRTRRTRR